MVKATLKPPAEIITILRDYARILNVGCGGCVSVCLVGGQREVDILNRQLENALRLEGLARQVDGTTLERQCNPQFLAGMADRLRDYDCVLSMACGAGVQLMAESFPCIPVFPAVNTMAIGVDREVGVYEERCRACGECVLAYTAGICPVTRCAKGLFNGPCGGTNQGRCEVDQEIPCAWCEIYERLSAQGRLADIQALRPPMQWKNQIPRTAVQPDFRSRYIRG